MITMLLARMLPFCICILTELLPASGRVSKYMRIANAAAARHAATIATAMLLLANHLSPSFSLFFCAPTGSLPCETPTDVYLGVDFSTTPFPVKTKALSSGITVCAASILTRFFLYCDIDAYTRHVISGMWPITRGR
jgi:hypothetical protein